MQPKSSLLAQLEQHQTTYAEEAAFRQQVIDFLHRNDAFWQRTTLEGHITGSAWVLSPDRGSALLIHHKKLNRWMQPGGHVDETDETVAHTALRELREETGMKDARLLRPYLFDVDVHEIPARGHEPTHLHLDLRYLFQAVSMELAADFSEVNNIQWVPLTSLVAEGTEQSIRRMALKIGKLRN